MSKNDWLHPTMKLRWFQKTPQDPPQLEQMWQVKNQEPEPEYGWRPIEFVIEGSQTEQMRKTPDETLKYLDKCIAYWRREEEQAKDRMDRFDLCSHYVDAYQSMRRALFGPAPSGKPTE